MTNDLEAFHLNARFFGIDARFTTGDLNLLVDGVHAVKIWQEQSASAALGHDHAILFDVQFGLVMDRFGIREDIHGNIEIRKLLGFDRRERGSF